VLSACHSESVTEAIISLGVRHIVAIEADASVYEIAAVQFYRRFYQTLLTSGTVQEAFTAGRNAVLTDDRLSRETALHEARKFKLLPEDQSHDTPLRSIASAGEPGAVRLAVRPRLTQPPFHRRPPYFIGRNADMRAVLRLLQQHRAALVRGVSGAGKTELAKETAHWLVARDWARPEHTAFVPLVGARTAADARSAIATELGLTLDQVLDNDEAANAALALRVPPAALLVLDEAENVIQTGGRAFRDLLEALAQSPQRPLLLVTSQSDVGSPRFPVHTLVRLAEDAALLLFARNANLSEAEWQRVNKADLLILLSDVDRLPRAIELLARVWRHRRSLDLRPLSRELRERRLEVLQDPYYPAEVKSVIVGVHLAYDRLRQLNPEAAALYANLALFPGGVTEAGVAAIFGEHARVWLADIEAQSLLERLFTDLPSAELLYLPTPFRFFAERQLPTGLLAAQNIHGEAGLRFYFDFPEEPHRGWVNQLDSFLVGAGEAMGAIIARYAAELPSIEAWLDWAYDHEPCLDARSRGPRLTALLENLYVVTNALHIQRSRFTKALTQAQRYADHVGEANVRKALGDLALREADLPTARTYYEAALAIYPAVGARLGEANVRQSLGNLALAEGNPAQAFEQYGAALELHGAIGDRLGMGADLEYMGRAAAAAGQHEQAALLHDQSLAVHRAIGERLGQALNLDDQADAFWELGLQQAAYGAWWQARALAKAIGLPLAARLDSTFARLEQELGSDTYQALIAELPVQAEVWRQEAIAALRQAHEDTPAQ
jgi:tetratricopeptide (TPR) repeat protein